VRFLTDENIPLSALHQSHREGFDFSTVSDLSPAASDEDVLKIACRRSRILMTIDKDFVVFHFKRRQKLPIVEEARLRQRKLKV